MSEKMIIIGSGPAGLTGLEPLMVEGMERGGQLMITTDVENFPGFPDGIMGPDLMEQIRKQAERFGTRIITSNVTEVDFSERPFKVWVGKDLYEADSVIISTGASARWLGVPGEKELTGYGVSACATCDGFFFRDRELIVVGGGDTAMEEALFLTKFASKVTVVHRRDEFRASTIMSDRVLKHPKVDVIWNAEVAEVYGDTVVQGVKLKSTVDGEIVDFKTDGVFVAIGHDPNTKIFVDHLDLDDGGYIVSPAGQTQTSVEGVFAAGDVSDKVYRQAITAAGIGCQAALDAERWLESTH
jgi:thioredoxin reductase (NADPH)